ncbi:MAG: DUF4350 domain-containing protein [Planctomycetota bacterium]
MRRWSLLAKIRAVLIGAGVISFLVAIVFALFGDLIFSPSSAQTNSFSYSALGHRAFVELLRDEGYRVVISRSRSMQRAGPSGLLILAEPEPYFRDEGGGNPQLSQVASDQKGPTLIVLPKRIGRQSEERPNWIEASDLDRESTPSIVLTKLVSGDIRRPDSLSGPFVDAAGGRVPVLLAQPQLVGSDDLTPIIRAPEGILVGEVPGSAAPLWILSDPDPMANHGLGDEGNAEFMLAIVAELCGQGGTVVVDETCHGFVRETTPYHELFQYPLLLATAQLLLVILLTLWCALRRFGPTLPLAPAIQPGKAALIENTASLLTITGSSYYSVARYFQMVLQDVGVRLHAPAGLGPDQLRAWLQAASDRRELSIDLDRLHRDLGRLRQNARLRARMHLARARQTHSWKEEILNGPGQH